MNELLIHQLPETISDTIQMLIVGSQGEQTTNRAHGQQFLARYGSLAPT